MLQQTIRFGTQEGRCAQAHGGAVDGQEEEGLHDTREEEETSSKDKGSLLGVHGPLKGSVERVKGAYGGHKREAIYNIFNKVNLVVKNNNSRGSPSKKSKDPLV